MAAPAHCGGSEPCECARAARPRNRSFVRRGKSGISEPPKRDARESHCPRRHRGRTGHVLWLLVHAAPSTAQKLKLLRHRV